MWVSIIVKMVTSEWAKLLIAMLVNKLLEAKGDGITKDVATAMLDGIAKSRSNNAPIDAFDVIKKVL
jgi:hypothetical protein